MQKVITNKPSSKLEKGSAIPVRAGDAEVFPRAQRWHIHKSQSHRGRGRCDKEDTNHPSVSARGEGYLHDSLGLPQARRGGVSASFSYIETGEGDSKDINWCSVGQRRETHVPDPVTSKRAVTSKDRGDTTSFCETKGRHRHICKTQSHLNRQLTGRTPIGLPQAGQGRHICRTQSHLNKQLTGRTPISLPQAGRGRHICKTQSHPDGQLMGRTPIGLRPNPYQGQAH